MKKYILFDFDGTVFDSAEGITKSVQYALGKMGIHAELDELMCFAGPPLDEMFALHYGMSEDEAQTAVRFYRERYTPIGWEECTPFAGMHELMYRLRGKGAKLQRALAQYFLDLAEDYADAVRRQSDALAGSDTAAASTAQADAARINAEAQAAAKAAGLADCAS